MLTGRSLNLLDIDKKLNSSGIAARDATISEGNIQYGNQNTYGSGVANTPEIYEHVGKTIEEGSKDYYTSPTSATHTNKDSLTVSQTYYGFEASACGNFFNDKIFHELVFNAENITWIASRTVDCYAAHARFGLPCISGGALLGGTLLRSNGNMYSYNRAIRPIVLLGADVKISTTGGTIDSPRNMSL